MASEEWGILNNPNALIEPGHDLFVWLLDRLCPCRLNRSPLAGFGVEGVVAGSLPAGAFYGRATTAVFSVLQSIGATLVWVPVAGSSVMAIQRARYSCPSVKGKEYPVLPIDVFSILLPIHSE